MYRLSLVCLMLLTIPLICVGAEVTTHKKVQQALDWQLPVNTCRKPKSISMTSSEDPAQGGKAQTDVDSYTINRYKRKEKRWNKCIDKYKAVLMDDFAALKDCAQYGLTKEQADIILSKLALIQKTVMELGT